MGVTLLLKRLFWLVMLGGLLSCAELPTPWPDNWDPQAYTVRSGDTLYSIAWRYEKDYRDIAEWNNIQAPYAIFPGQRLAMSPSSEDGTQVAADRPQLLSTEDGQLLEADAESPAEVTPQATAEKPSHTKVKQNETLYSIARREGYSHHQLARWNHIKPPYRLYPGQKIRLSPPGAALGSRSSGPASSASQATVSSVKPVIVQAKPLASSEAVSTTSSPQPSGQSTGQASVQGQSIEMRLPRTVSQWRWPVKGKLTKTYRASDMSRKGIGISGRIGQTVKSAAAGTVVYSGNGLINYGNLVIIKHSHSFLSAYAHNQSLLVKEGDNVKSGQAIAKMGKYESGKASLHFEIRRNGKPVNPLHYLPKS